MKTWRFGIAVGLLAGLGACSDMMGHNSSASKPVAMAQPTVAPDMVRQVQGKLRDDGYYKQGPVDGVWGQGTESAVRSFQRDHNLGSSGQLDVPTLQALNVGTVPANNTMNGPASGTTTQPTYNDPSAPMNNPTSAQPR